MALSPSMPGLVKKKKKESLWLTLERTILKVEHLDKTSMSHLKYKRFSLVLSFM